MAMRPIKSISRLPNRDARGFVAAAVPLLHTAACKAQPRGQPRAELQHVIPVQTKSLQKQANALKSRQKQRPQSQEEEPPQQQQPAAPRVEWSGLSGWRARGVDPGRLWGAGGPCAATTGSTSAEAEEGLAGSLVECAVQVLRTSCPQAKADLTHRAWQAYNSGHLPLHPLPPNSQHSPPLSSAHAIGASGRPPGPPSSPSLPAAPLAPSAAPSPCPLTPQPCARGHEQQLHCLAPLQLPERPARPAKPLLVAAKQVPSFERGQSPMSSLSAHLLHNLAHIELNAIDLAWDSVARFAHLPLPPLFFEDFARVADDEGRHLGWCLQRLAELGHQYGDMPAHDMLWQGCQASSTDLTARLALVPMSQEARGLDAGTRLAARLTGSGDNRSAAIVQRIAQEEHAHVAVGVAWFKRVCDALDLQAVQLFRHQVSALSPDLLKGSFNHVARQRVGLDRALYDTSMWPSEAVNSLATAGRTQAPNVSCGQPLVCDVVGEPGFDDSAASRPWQGTLRPIGASGELQPVAHLNTGQLLQLRQRLALILDVEGVADSLHTGPLVIS
ncbi:hypothetical protein V8C86DRAFT_1819161 [Haematococcus lacustris]